MEPGGLLSLPLRAARTALGVPLCLVALALPYRARARYLAAIAWCAHAPFLLFGIAARLLLAGLEEPSGTR